MSTNGFQQTQRAPEQGCAGASVRLPLTYYAPPDGSLECIGNTVEKHRQNRDRTYPYSDNRTVAETTSAVSMRLVFPARSNPHL